MVNKHIVPFGKYKGQSVEVMQNDSLYCDWLMTQDWFRNRYAEMHQIIINNFGEPTETPEHNKLQALFLDDDFCLSLVFLLEWEPANEPANYLLTSKFAYNLKTDLEQAEKDLKEATDELIAAEVERKLSTFYGANYWKREIEKANEKKEICCEKLNVLNNYIKNDEKVLKNLLKIYGRRFESNGWDVVFNVEFELKELEITTETSVGIEIKPSLGDDYPAILRQMKNNYKHDSRYRDYVLVFEQFTASGATVEQVKKIFNESGFYFIQLTEIQIHDNADTKLKMNAADSYGV